MFTVHTLIKTLNKLCTKLNYNIIETTTHDIFDKFGVLITIMIIIMIMILMIIIMIVKLLLLLIIIILIMITTTIVLIIMLIIILMIMITVILMHRYHHEAQCQKCDIFKRRGGYFVRGTASPEQLCVSRQ